MAEKCWCEAAKEGIEAAYTNPNPYYGVLQDIMDAEIDYARMCEICPCRKRRLDRGDTALEPEEKRKMADPEREDQPRQEDAQECQADHQDPDDVSKEEPDQNRACTSDNEGEDGSVSEREAIESDVEEKEALEEGRSSQIELATCLGESLEDWLPPKKQCGDCHRCALARLTLGEVRQTAAAKIIFEEAKASCIKCSGRVREVIKCHCAENFEWKLRFVTKTEKKLQGLQFLLH